MDFLGIIALVITGLLALIGVAMWGKISKIFRVIKLIVDALTDKVLTKEEFKEIWEEIRKQ